ncbi:MAG: SGNH/GDSL hydrolase family protein, partial [Gordonia sp. (in: high G+C Gram-positive bacteria)]
MTGLRLRAVVGLGVLLMAGCASTPTPARPGSSAAVSDTTATPTSTTYVALGDSYAAGTGVDPLVAGSKYLCQQSARNLAH